MEQQIQSSTTGAVAIRAVAIGAPIPGSAFRQVLAEALAARGFRALGQGVDDPGALALRVAGARDRAGWLVLESGALRGGAEDLARDIASRLGAPATVCTAEGASAAGGVLLCLTTVEPDGRATRTERPAEYDDDLGELEAVRLVELVAVRAATDGDGGSSGGGDRVLYHATTKPSTGNRRLDHILRAIEAGASYSFEDHADGRVMVRIDRGSAGRQLSMLSGDEARALRDALA